MPANASILNRALIKYGVLSHRTVNWTAVASCSHRANLMTHSCPATSSTANASQVLRP